MKKLYSYLAILMSLSISFGLHSCTADQESAVNNPQNKLEQRALSSNYTTNSSKMAANIINPYDAEGRYQYEIKATYISKGILAINSIDKKKSRTTSNLPAEIVPDILDNLDLTEDAKLNLGPFLDSLLILSERQERHEIIHELIVAYESNILFDDLLIEEDKKNILISTAVIRYATSEEPTNPPKNKDPDWTIFLRVPPQ